MKFTERPSLQPFNTFGLDCRAAALIEIENEEDLLELPGFDPQRDFVLGGGSNVVLLGDVPGTVYLNRIGGVEVVDEHAERVRVEAGAGENWHDLVRWTLDQGLSGLENLSLIPGSVGAAPIQNIGAYGVELAAVLESVTAWDWRAGRWATLSREDCRLGYRDSRFRSADAGRYLITSVRLSLSRVFEPRIDYPGLAEELDGTRPTARAVSDAVIRLRRRKLPDPSVAGNAGSFFKNPVIGRDEAEQLRSRHAALPAWPLDNGQVKLSAAWMIEACGLKGRQEGGARVSPQHALVLVNEGGASGHDVSALAVEVQKAVYEAFGVRLEPEPLLVEFPAD
jgi:UDP-N-acetylmuramate dehydrogenase